jgi:hypothetical protein
MNEAKWNDNDTEVTMFFRLSINCEQKIGVSLVFNSTNIKMENIFNKS